MRILRLAAAKALVLLGTVFIAVLGPSVASATLGEPESSVQTDMVQFKASIKSSTMRIGYRVHEIQLPSGTTMREFVGSDGNVFAVAWSGPYAPDLRQAFGAYFATFVAAPKPKYAGHTHLQIESNGLTVQIGGHMRAHAGRAYLTAAIPNGMNLGDLH